MNKYETYLVGRTMEVRTDLPDHFIWDAPTSEQVILALAKYGWRWAGGQTTTDTRKRESIPIRVRCGVMRFNSAGIEAYTAEYSNLPVIRGAV